MEDPVYNTWVTISGMMQHKHSEWEKLERILLTIDGGTLALSVTIFTNRTDLLLHPDILKLSWGSLVLALVFLMLSYAFGELFASDLISKVKEHDNNVITQSQIEAFKNEGMQLGINLSNYASLGLTIVGIILLVIFGFFNIS